MIISAHQPNFLPYCGFFDKIAKADLFVLLDTVQYDSNDFQNRNYIKTANGKLLLTVPVKGGRNQLIKDVEIDNGRNWQRKHLKSIELAYKKAPYFDKYYSYIETIYNYDWKQLCLFNKALIEFICVNIGIDFTKIVKASDYNFQGKKSDLVLDMVKALGSTKYIFGSQGKGYADIESFTEAGIEVEFQDYTCKPYNQLHGEFLSHMSVLDLLFNMGDKSLEVIKGE